MDIKCIRVKKHRHQRVDLGCITFTPGSFVIPEERSFRLFPGLVLLSSFSWVSLSSRLWFWSFCRDRAALSWTKPAVLLTLSLSYPEETPKNEWRAVRLLFSMSKSTKNKPLQSVATQFNSSETFTFQFNSLQLYVSLCLTQNSTHIRWEWNNYPIDVKVKLLKVYISLTIM